MGAARKLTEAEQLELALLIAEQTADDAGEFDEELPEEEQENEIPEEIYLWAEVIKQAFRDLYSSERPLRDSAHAFLSGEDGVLEIICDALNADPDEIINAYKEGRHNVTSFYRSNNVSLEG